MKKVIAAVIILIIMLSNIAIADNFDFSAMTDEELDALITNAITEQWKRKGDNYKYYTDDWDYKGDDGLSIRLRDYEQNYGTVVICILEVDNDTDEEIRINPKNAKINGWDIDCYCYDTVSAHGRRRCNLSFDINQAGIDDSNEVDQFTLSFVVERARDHKELYTIGPLYYSRS